MESSKGLRRLATYSVIGNEFSLNANSKLSAVDIELVEETLKQKFKFKMDSEKLKEMKYFTFNWPLYLAGVKKLTE